MRSGRPITISSGYRCPTLNQRIGEQDKRTWTAARQTSTRGMSPVSVAQAIVNADIELDQLIYEGAWFTSASKPDPRRAGRPNR